MPPTHTLDHVRRPLCGGIFFSWIRCLLLWVGLLAGSVGSLSWAQGPTASQVIALEPGWNLISIQVGGNLTPAAFQASLGAADASKLRSIWGFGSAAAPGAAPWQWKFHRTDPGYPNDLLALQPGLGYWVEVTGFCQAALTGLVWDGEVALKAGWNLVGFPGLVQADAELHDLASVFGSQFDRITQVWGWDATGSQRFVGYDIAAIPQVKELSGVRPGSGYWVYALAEFSLNANPALIMTPDADLAPLAVSTSFTAADSRWRGSNPASYVGMQVQWAGTEDADLDLNNNGVLDDIWTQDTMIYYNGVDRKIISIKNRGTGVANWSLVNEIPWLYTATRNEQDYPGNAGRPKNASGSVSSETDTVVLYADTRGLLPGRQVGQFSVWLGNTRRQINVLLDVPAASGDWKGYATTKTVNGKAIPIGAVDMGLNLFMDEGSNSRFKAVLNKDTSLLFPRDVFMTGIFYSGNQFSLTTNFEMPAGDRNTPPYSTFQRPANYDSLSTVAKARADYDANGDGKLDASNPFPIALHRGITLQGTRTTPSHLEGTYTESISGMLPNGEPVVIEGSFVMDRQTYIPTLRSIVNERSTSTTVSLGGSSGTLFRETTINVGPQVNIQGATLGLNLTFPDPTKLTISLIGPNGQVVVIHDRGATLPTSVDLSQFNGQNGQGTWKLRVAWTATPERGTLASWTLNLQGLSTYSVSGRIVAQPFFGPVADLAGAQVTLAGGNLLEQRSSSADGSFSFYGLTENAYSLSISRPGYVAKTYSFFLNNKSLYIGNQGAGTDSSLLQRGQAILLEKISTETPTLMARPWIGQESLTVMLTNESAPWNFYGTLYPFSSIIPNLDTLRVLWNFGDGTPAVLDTDSSADEITVDYAKHIYAKAGTYTPSIVLTTSMGSVTLTGQPITVTRATPMTGAGAPTHQLLAFSFQGSIASPLTNSAPPVSFTGAGTVRQEIKPDSATFDIDRFPFLAVAGDFHPTAEDTDFTSEYEGVAGPVYVSGNGTATLPFLIRSYSAGGDPAYDFSPATWLPYPVQTPRDRFRMVMKLGGPVFQNQLSTASGLSFQSGRTSN